MRLEPRITYWTGIWEPRSEALSREVDSLRRALAPGCPVVSLSSGQRSGVLPAAHVVRLSGKRWVLHRALASIVEPAGQVTHAFGGVGDWHLLRALGRRPLLFTVALPGPALEPEIYRKVSVFAVHTRALEVALVEAGAPIERIRAIPPAVDLERFRPSAPPKVPRFRLLFASSPADPEELDRRGVSLLVDLARVATDIEILILLRPWGDPERVRARIDAMSPPANVRVEMRDVADMSAIYRDVHAVLCAYEAGYGMSAPASVVEGFASGRPALVAETCGIASEIEEAGVGAAGSRSVAGLAAALDRLRRDYPASAERALEFARSRFDQRGVHATYARIYAELARRSELVEEPRP